MIPPPLADGFEAGGRFFPWGTTLAEVGEGAFGPGRVFGLEVLSARVDAPRPDRPVTELWWELPHRPVMPWRRVGDVVERRVVEVFGPADSREDHDIGTRGDFSGMICHTARWRFGQVRLGLSVYGAPRAQGGGRYACGALYASWQDTATAAAPFVAEREAADAELSAVVAGAEVLLTVFVDADLAAYYAGEAPDPDERRAALALAGSDLSVTPEALARTLPMGAVALWRGPTTWGVSTSRDTAAFRLGEPVEVSRTETQPAKGGGSSALQIGALGLLDLYGSEAIPALAARLADEGLATVTLQEGYDV